MSSTLDKIALQSAMQEYLEHLPQAFISADVALSPELVDMPMFRAPIWGYSSPEDPLYRGLLQPEAVGPCFMLPHQWLPSTQSILSFFIPFSHELAQTNLVDRDFPSSACLHGRHQGQKAIDQFSQKLCDYLSAQGYEAVSPAIDPRFSAVRFAETNPAFPPEMSFTSRWSEQHVAYISGLGTFGLSKGLITEAGICGRFGSVITSAPFAPRPRAYT